MSTSAASGIPAPGFADPTRDSQRVFRAVLDALAHPARPYPVSGADAAPEPLGRVAGAIALTIVDEESPIWLDEELAAHGEVAAWLAFHTGARVLADARDAAFVFANRPELLPQLADLAEGDDEAPQLSATVVLGVRDAVGLARFRASGPGIEHPLVLDAPWAPEGFLAAWARNHARFPRGVDLLLAAEAEVVGLPRTTRLEDASGARSEQEAR